jgi:hypothetical protein
MNLVKGTIYRFRNRENAFNFSIWVILGDDDYFWACASPADFSRLEKAGYSVAT